MRRRRTGAIVAWILILACLGVLSFVHREFGPGRVLAARVDRDCSPWDGPAFTITIPESSGEIMISIWREPEIPTASCFRFPDQTRRWGSAMLRTGNDRWIQLRGNVTLQSVIPGEPVRGWLDLTHEERWHLRAEFRAEWESIAVYCA